MRFKIKLMQIYSVIKMINTFAVDTGPRKWERSGEFGKCLTIPVKSTELNNALNYQGKHK